MKVLIIIYRTLIALTLTLIIFFIWFVYSLTSPNCTISGIGVLQINKLTPTELSTYQYSFKEIKQSSFDKQVRLFYIDSMTVADIKITNVWIYFLDNKLYSIECTPSYNIEHTFDIKYGEPNKISSIDKYPILLNNKYWINKELNITAILSSNQNCKHLSITSIDAANKVQYIRKSINNSEISKYSGL